ncbi:Uncharacterised protein [Mycobacteroides abscessus subsp. abscessus]|nr:Uncharacterised protein [Mycobacteroides abscessus subsp. abscessus]
MVVSRVAAAGSLVWLPIRPARVPPSSSGMSPEVTTTVPAKPAGSACRPQATACPVPNCCSWTAISIRLPRDSARMSTAVAIRSRS